MFLGRRKLVLVAAIALIGIFTLRPFHFDATYHWDIPDHFPKPPVPPGNPMADEKVELGRYLFYDTRLSINQTTSCATCHKQELAFTDGLDLAIGATEEVHSRSSMSLTNVAYNTRLTWANPLLDKLESQALVPMFGETPVEMGLVGMEDTIVRLIKEDEIYSTLFKTAFPESQQPYTVANIANALASFQRALISANAPYDRYVQGDTTALSDSARRGLNLFLSERLECFHCHGGFNFTDATRHDSQEVLSVAFHNTGLYNEDGRGSFPSDNTGVHGISGKPGDMGRFRAPTLRNIAVTAPYMHDGSIASLEGVIEHYADGGRANSPLTSEFVPGFVITESEKHDLLAFLNSLTDETFLTDQRFSDPFR